MNSKVIHLRSEIADAEQGMRATQANSTNREGNELAAARHREKLLQLTYTAQVGTVSADLQKTAQVRPFAPGGRVRATALRDAADPR